MPYGITQSYLPPGRGDTSDLDSSPIEDERLSRPDPVNDLPSVATEVTAIPGVSWLSRPNSAPLSIVGVNNLPTVVTQ